MTEVIAGLPALITACADLYKQTVTGRHFDRDVHVIVDRAAVQQMRFAYWLERAGFVQGTAPTMKLPPVAQRVVKDHLDDIKVTLIRFGDLVDEYELPGPGAPGQMTLPEAFWRLRVTSGGKPAPPSVKKRVAKPAKLPKWAAAQQERANKFLKDLQVFNDDLDWIAGNAASLGAQTVPARVLSHLWGDNLQHFFEAASQYEPELARCADMKRQVLAAAKLSAASKTPSLRIPWATLSKQRATKTSRLVAAEFKDKPTAKAKPVLLEDKTYAGMAGIKPEHAKLGEKFAEARVAELAMVLGKSHKPHSLRILDCAGYAQNSLPKTFSLVFYYPDHAVPDTAPISLQKLLPRGPNGWALRHKTPADTPAVSARPSLHTRYAMAQSICQTFAVLHATGVLHKAVTTSNIVFFKHKTAGTTPGFQHDLTRPYTTGFSWTRTHGPEYVSEVVPGLDYATMNGVLQAHPAYSVNTNQRYMKMFDLYGLGLVLLQIGLWRSLEDITDDIFPAAKSRINETGFKLDEAAGDVRGDKWLADSIALWQFELQKRQRSVDQSDGISLQKAPRAAFQEAMVKNLPHFLFDTMGEVYTRVVARCLTGDVHNDGLPNRVLPLKSEEGVPEYILQDAIVRNVVEELNKCKA